MLRENSGFGRHAEESPGCTKQDKVTENTGYAETPWKNLKSYRRNIDIVILEAAE